MRFIVRYGSVFVSLVIATTVLAYSAIVWIDDLVAESELIVTGNVISVRSLEKSEIALAIIKVDAVWKGDPRIQHVEYVASPGWYMCDNSNAEMGERVVLFLARDSPNGRLHIAHHGRGRMRISEDGLQVRPYEVLFPRPGQPPAQHRIMDLAELETFVRYSSFRTNQIRR